MTERPVAMMSRLKVEFDQPEHGWLKVELRSAQIELSDTFSHIYPTLPNLCEALCAVAEGKGSRPVVFLLEPQELELSFTSQENQTCIVNAVLFPDRRRDLENGEVVFAHSGSSREVVLAFWRALRQLQTCLPEHEFTVRWREPFPAKEMAALTVAVATIKTEQPDANTRTAG
jgi:hypothetical protein